MYIRCLVAVKDFNANVGRPDKKVNGKTLYKMKVCTRHTVLYEMLDLFCKIKTIIEKQYNIPFFGQSGATLSRNGSLSLACNNF